MELWNLELLLPLLLPLLLLLLLLLWLPLLSPMRLAKSDPTPNQQNPTKANVRKMIKISADNQVTKKTPKHVDVWITTAFFFTSKKPNAQEHRTHAHTNNLLFIQKSTQ